MKDATATVHQDTPSTPMLLPTAIRITPNSVQDAHDWKVLFHLRESNKSPPEIKVIRAQPPSTSQPVEEIIATISYRGISAQPDIVLNITGASQETILRSRGNGRPIQYAFESQGKTLPARRTWVMISKSHGTLRDSTSETGGGNEVAELKNGRLNIWKRKQVELEQEQILEILLTAVAVVNWGKRKWRGGKARGAALSAVLNCVVS